MKKIELWKVRRELWRIKEQGRVNVVGPALDRVRQVVHDTRVDKLVRRRSGVQPLTDRIAIFVLFQPKGVAASAILTLDHLRAEGWSVVVVSNAPLSDGDRVRVLERSSLVIERPNTGYDFGAYREGLRQLRLMMRSPERLILMNDSTWFPLRDGDDTLRRMEASGADMAGHIYKIESMQKRGRDHLESHLLMFHRRALEHPRMKRFWRRFVMSDSRENTIRRGEKGVTQAALAAGLKVQGLLDRDRVVAMLGELSENELVELLRNLVLHRTKERDLRVEWLADAARGEPLRERLLKWSETELSSSVQHFVSVTFIEFAVARGGMGFLKKARDTRHHLAKMALLRGVDAGRIRPINPVIRKEVETAIRDWEPPYEWKPENGEPREVSL